jgi:hypothetical protein
MVHSWAPIVLLPRDHSYKVFASQIYTQFQSSLLSFFAQRQELPLLISCILMPQNCIRSEKGRKICAIITIFSSSEVFFYISNYITLYISWEFLACIKLFILTSLYLKQNIQILLKKMHHEKRKNLQPNDISEWCLCENNILFKYQVTCFHFCFQVK